jgi:catechol 2,3-dioxygenase-like lactoylglutathione lyase family enzyme
MPLAQAVETGSVPSVRVDRPPFRRVDRVVIPVPTLREGLDFYRDRLGHEILWLSEDSAGLRLPESEAELVLQTRRAEFVPDLTVTSLDSALDSIARAGGSVSGSPFRTNVGRCAIVKDPWGNRFVLREPTAPASQPQPR